ncbi:MAG: class I SAM-dependent methyltransferase [Planctomycetota bacterium]|jgi:2-polyprenyl-3-methyl-5-hydroxy-6-metoxy-1,4-benzoquinol methylase
MPDQVNGLLSPFLRARRIAAARPHVSCGRVLDVGCGSGQLADLVEPRRYVGYDLDGESVRQARVRHPEHLFLTADEFQRDQATEQFDVIVALAVIEHIEEPVSWLLGLRDYLRPEGLLVLTTPHPRFRLAHQLGAAVGVFSKEAADEHKALLDWYAIHDAAERASLHIEIYRRFLLGVAQLFVLRRLP